jgi:hypothetical protein
MVKIAVVGAHGLAYFTFDMRPIHCSGVRGSVVS